MIILFIPTFKFLDLISKRLVAINRFSISRIEETELPFHVLITCDIFSSIFVSHVKTLIDHGYVIGCRAINESEDVAVTIVELFLLEPGDIDDGFG